MVTLRSSLGSSTPTVAWLTTLASATLALTAVTFVSPFFSLIGGLTMLALVIVAKWPHVAVPVAGFLSAAFPKAGVKLGGFPFPVFIFVLALCIMYYAYCSSTRPLPRPAYLLGATLLLWIAVRAITMGQAAEWTAVLTYIAWAAVPLVLLFVCLSLTGEFERWRRALDWGFVLACAFGFVQFFLGVEETAVPGLTIAYGDSYESKNNIIFSSGGEVSKIMSTYQNGNIFSVVAAFFCVSATMRLVGGSGRRSDLILVVAAGCAVLLSGSRTGLVVVLIGCAVVVARNGSTLRKVSLALSGIVLYYLITLLQPALVARYSFVGGIESGGAGRSQMWSDAFSEFALDDWLFGSGVALLREGGVGLVQQHGVLGIVLLAATVWALTTRLPDLRILFALLGLAALIDSSYMLFPTWFIPAVAVVGASHCRSRPWREDRSADAGLKKPADLLQPGASQYGKGLS